MISWLDESEVSRDEALDDAAAELTELLEAAGVVVKCKR